MATKRIAPDSSSDSDTPEVKRARKLTPRELNWCKTKLPHLHNKFLRAYNAACKAYEALEEAKFNFFDACDDIDKVWNEDNSDRCPFDYETYIDYKSTANDAGNLQENMVWAYDQLSDHFSNAKWTLTTST